LLDFSIIWSPVLGIDLFEEKIAPTDMAERKIASEFVDNSEAVI